MVVAAPGGHHAVGSEGERVGAAGTAGGEGDIVIADVDRPDGLVLLNEVVDAQLAVIVLAGSIDDIVGLEDHAVKPVRRNGADEGGILHRGEGEGKTLGDGAIAQLPTV